MSVDTLHAMEAIKIHNEGESSVIMGATSQQSMETGSEVRGEATAGETSSRFLSLVEQNPLMNFDTLAIDKALTTIGQLGLAITSGVNPGVVAYLKKRKAGASFETGANHRSYTIKSGMIIPQSLTAEGTGDASIGYQAPIIYDGTNNPIVIADGVALPTGQVDDERFGLGPATVGGIVIGQLNSLNLEFGLELEIQRDGSALWATHISIKGNQPKLTLSGSKVTLLKQSSDLLLVGNAATHANTAFYLRARKNADTFELDTALKHIKISTDGMAIVTQPYSVSGRDSATIGLEVTSRNDGTNLPLVITTGVAIPP